MRKIFVILVVIALFVFVIGCANNDEQSGEAIKKLKTSAKSADQLGNAQPSTGLNSPVKSSDELGNMKTVNQLNCPEGCGCACATDGGSSGGTPVPPTGPTRVRGVSPVPAGDCCCGVSSGILRDKPVMFYNQISRTECQQYNGACTDDIYCHNYVCCATDIAVYAWLPKGHSQCMQEFPPAEDEYCGVPETPTVMFGVATTYTANNGPTGTMQAGSVANTQTPSGIANPTVITTPSTKVNPDIVNAQRVKEGVPR
jgi:hypothetical protein